MRELKELSEQYPQLNHIIHVDSHFDKLKLKVLLGLVVGDDPINLSLADSPHLFVVGETEKRYRIIHSILLSLLYRYSPDDLRIVLCDLINGDLSLYNDEPHLLHPVITDIHNSKKMLIGLLEHMEYRYRLLAELGVRNIVSYNDKLSKNDNDSLSKYKKLSYHIVIIDDFELIIKSDAELIEDVVIRLIQLSRAVGIHIIFSSRSCNKNVFTPLISEDIYKRILLINNNEYESIYFMNHLSYPCLQHQDDVLL